MHYVAVVPTLDRPPLGHFRHWPADAPDQNLFVIPVDLAVSSSWTEHIITANASLRRHQTGRPLLPKGGVVAQVDSAGSTRRADDSPRLAVVEQAGGMAHLSPKDLWPCPIVLPMWSRGFAAACCDVGTHLGRVCSKCIVDLRRGIFYWLVQVTMRCVVAFRSTAAILFYSRMGGSGFAIPIPQ